MNNLTLRVLSAVIMGIVAVSSLYFSYFTRWTLVSLLLTLGAWESTRMMQGKLKFTPPRFLVFLAPLFTFAFMLLQHPFIGGAQSLTSLLTGLSILVFTLVGFWFVPLEHIAPWIISSTGITLFFGLWVGSVFDLISQAPGLAGFSQLLFVALAMVTADTGAYFSGKSLGKHKLCPQISPKKTIEGLMGGILATLILGAFAGPALTGLSLLPSLFLGLLLSLTATMGDLLFSALKRYGGVKDSSQLIPGHGGVVDRFDSLFFSIPLAVLYLNLLN